MSVSRIVVGSVPYQTKREGRSKRGNVIVFMVAVSCTFLLAFLLFALSFARLLGTNHEQKSGIDAAALAAAKDLSRIVIDDPNFGLIGLSDSAPIGPDTLANDGYYLQVHSINSILGTIRLDMIIADELHDPVMMQFAQRDYTNARLAAKNLILALQQSLLPDGSSGGTAAASASSLSSNGGGSAGNGTNSGAGSSGGRTSFYDANGNLVTPYSDAVSAYESNQIRMAGDSQYVEGSMQLTLGSLQGGGPTNTPTPQPSSYAYADGNLSNNGKYMSYVNARYDTNDFVFAGVGDAIKLVDLQKFVVNDDSLPYTIPTIVKVEADQRLLQGNDIAGRIVHAVACAQPASTVDPMPAPGKFSISFPGPTIGKLGKPADLITDPELGSPPVAITSPTGGDTPGTGSLAPATWPFTGSNPTLGNAFSGGFYDWIRRGGTKLKVDAIKAMMNQAFLNSAASSGGLMQNYEIQADGTVLQTLHARNLTPALQESQNQLHSTAPLSTTDSTGTPTNYIVTVRDWVYQPGRINGGKHAGEPLPNPLLDTTILAQTHITGSLLAQQSDCRNLEIAQGLELGAGGYGAGAPGGCGGSTGGSRGGDDGSGDGTGGSCGGSGSSSSGGSCGGSGSSSSGGSCGGTGGSTSSSTLIQFTQGPGPRPGAVRPTYTHNGSAVDFEFAVDTSSGVGTATAAAASAQ